MTEQQQVNYERVAKAIDYIRENFKSQPSLDDIAASVHLSPFHFQRLFGDWAGTTPKKFLQYISTEYAKTLLKQPDVTLFDVAYDVGLSGTSRLHDLFINIEGMTPAEYKSGGKSLSIHYSFTQSPFGNLILASTAKGICYMAFFDERNEAVLGLKASFPNASFEEGADEVQQAALMIFQNGMATLPKIKLHLKATAFQLKVWEALLKIPSGKLFSYGALSRQLGMPGASRAVGSAIGSNPVAFLIPCHRVIQSSGGMGGYRWGNTRKTAIIGWEGALNKQLSDS